MEERSIMVVEHSISAPGDDTIVKEVIGEKSMAPERKKVFPLTNFSTTFQDLTTKDAEAAFEIAVRMRLVLLYRLGALSPKLSYEKPDGSVTFVTGPEVAGLLDLRFGGLPNQTSP